MRRTVLWDSSAILALLDDRDQNHARALDVATRIARERRPSLITNYLEVEAHALLLRKLGRALALEWLLSDSLTVERATSADEERARAILASHRDKDWSLCDAIAFAVIERRRIPFAFSFDRHFLQRGGFEVLGSR